MVALPYPYSYGAYNGVTFSSSSSSISQYRIVVVMCKRKKSPSPKGSDPDPPRIKSNLKRNLQILKFQKDVQKRKSPKPVTRYRKKKAEKQDLPVPFDDDTKLYPDSSLSLHNTKQVRKYTSPVLLVDGYNVCGYWPKLKKHFMNGELSTARYQLLQDLSIFSMMRGVKVVVVFDARTSMHSTHRENLFGIDIVYSRDADTYIGKEVAVLKEGGCPKVWVATSDHDEQHSAYGSGAFIWSCEALISQVKRAIKEEDRMVREESSTSSQGCLLKESVDSKVVAALRDLRDKLAVNEIKSIKSKRNKEKKEYNIDSKVVVSLRDLVDKLPMNEVKSLKSKQNEEKNENNRDSKVVVSLRDLRDKLPMNEVKSIKSKQNEEKKG